MLNQSDADADADGELQHFEVAGYVVVATSLAAWFYFGIDNAMHNL